jgi:hypothetical protein
VRFLRAGGAANYQGEVGGQFVSEIGAKILARGGFEAPSDANPNGALSFNNALATTLAEQVERIFLEVLG